MDFSKALDIDLSKVERPPLIPEGTYEAMVFKQPFSKVVGKEENWEKLVFPIKLISATDDVNAEELANFGDVTKSYNERVFMFDKNDQASFDVTLFQVKNFLEKTLGIDKGLSLREALAASVNMPLLVTVKWAPNEKNPEAPYANIVATAPIG